MVGRWWWQQRKQCGQCAICTALNTSRAVRACAAACHAAFVTCAAACHAAFVTCAAACYDQLTHTG